MNKFTKSGQPKKNEKKRKKVEHFHVRTTQILHMSVTLRKRFVRSKKLREPLGRGS